MATDTNDMLAIARMISRKARTVGIEGWPRPFRSLADLQQLHGVLSSS